MAIEVTEEMRRAVYAADCERLGHLLDVSTALGALQGGGNGVGVGSPDPDRLPHVSCRRCPKVWLLVEEPGEDYDDAVAKLRDRMKDPDTVRPRPRPADPSGPAPSRVR